MFASLSDVGLGLLAFLAGVATGLWLQARQQQSTSWGIALLGALVGLLVGLSSSPVVAGTITAAFALATTLLPKFLERRADREDSATAEPPSDSTRELRWLLPFSALAMVGVIVGITLRVNNALDFGSRNLREEFREQGFTDDQVDRIMDRLAGEVTPSKRDETADKTGLLHGQGSTLGWPEVWSFADVMSDDSKLDFIRRQAPAADYQETNEVIDRMLREGKTVEEIVTELKSKFKE